jgi:hypothetical protein
MAYRSSSPYEETEDVLVYIESINRQAGTVLIDFIDSNEFGKFSDYVNLAGQLGGPSMVLVRNYNLRRIQENTIYVIPKAILESLGTNGLVTRNPVDSYIIGFIVTLNDSIVHLFHQAVSFTGFAKTFRNQINTQIGNVENIPSLIHGQASLVVRNVEQGNWNELVIDGQVKIVFDVGAPVSASKEKVNMLLSDRDSNYQKVCPGVILSHWDVDHYKSLLALSTETLSRFSFFICRAELPTLTSRIVYSRIERCLSSDRIFSILPEPKIKASNPLKLLSDTNNQILIFNGHEHKDRNKSGIVLAVRTSKSNVVFSGDVHYNQLSKYVLPFMNYASRHVLVVPHHGGDAGKFNYDLSYKNLPGAAVISTGVNNYGHPKQKNINLLRALGFTILNTNVVDGDVAVKL